jgi:hypothetical protein
VDEGNPLPRPFRCWVPGHPQAVLKWRPALEASLPSGVEQQQDGALLNVPRAEMRHAGDYVCAAYDPHDDPQGQNVVESTPVRVRLPSFHFAYLRGSKDKCQLIIGLRLRAFCAENGISFVP